MGNQSILIQMYEAVLVEPYVVSRYGDLIEAEVVLRHLKELG